MGTTAGSISAGTTWLKSQRLDDALGSRGPRNLAPETPIDFAHLVTLLATVFSGQSTLDPQMCSRTRPVCLLIWRRYWKHQIGLTPEQMDES